jgi:p-aminobenzoyl-glutamate transporter AbgT
MKKVIVFFVVFMMLVVCVSVYGKMTKKDKIRKEILPQQEQEGDEIEHSIPIYVLIEYIL